MDIPPVAPLDWIEPELEALAASPACTAACGSASGGRRRGCGSTAGKW